MIHISEEELLERISWLFKEVKRHKKNQQPLDLKTQAAETTATVVAKVTPIVDDLEAKAYAFREEANIYKEALRLMADEYQTNSEPFLEIARGNVDQLNHVPVHVPAVSFVISIWR